MASKMTKGPGRAKQDKPLDKTCECCEEDCKCGDCEACTADLPSPSPGPRRW